MKINIDIDLSPEEARKIMGLPDLEPMQKQMLEKIQAKIPAHKIKGKNGFCGNSRQSGQSLAWRVYKRKDYGRVRDLRLLSTMSI